MPGHTDWLGFEEDRIRERRVIREAFVDEAGDDPAVGLVQKLSGKIRFAGDGPFLGDEAIVDDGQAIRMLLVQTGAADRDQPAVRRACVSGPPPVARDRQAGTGGHDIVARLEGSLDSPGAEIPDRRDVLKDRPLEGDEVEARVGLGDAGHEIAFVQQVEPELLVVLVVGLVAHHHQASGGLSGQNIRDERGGDIRDVLVFFPPPARRMRIDRERPHRHLRADRAGLDPHGERRRRRALPPLLAHLPPAPVSVVIVPRRVLGLPPQPPQMAEPDLRGLAIDFKNKVAGREFLPPFLEPLRPRP